MSLLRLKPYLQHVCGCTLFTINRHVNKTFATNVFLWLIVIHKLTEIRDTFASTIPGYQRGCFRAIFVVISQVHLRG